MHEAMTQVAEQPSRPLGREDYKTLALSALGGTLEFYDFVIFVFFTAVIGRLFFPPSLPDWMVQLQTLGIFAAGYLARPVGGIVIAHFGDRFGRKRMFTLSIFLMAAPTLLIGLLPTYETLGLAAPLLLLAMRVLQGAAIGGEMPGAWVFVAEHVPPKHLGLGVGLLTSGIAGGILVGALVAIGINRVFTPDEVHDYAWRLPFILGGVFGLVSVYLRGYLSETPIFKELAARRALAKELPVKTVMRDHRAACLLTAILTWALSTAVVVVILMTPTLLQKAYGIAPTAALEANCIATLMLVIGNVFFGWCCDRFGTRTAMILGWGGLALSAYYFYTHLAGIAPATLTLNYAVLGFFAGVTATMPIISVRAFPPAVRFSGLSFAYNLAYAVVGGFTPVLTQLWLQRDPLAPAHYVAVVSLLAIATTFVPLAVSGYRTASGTHPLHAN